jgi:hypothetical protein
MYCLCVERRNKGFHFFEGLGIENYAIVHDHLEYFV